MSQRRAQLEPAQADRLRRFGVAASTDVHCHCLPGLDDGPADLAAALDLCRALVADGVTTAVATPHQLGRYRNPAATVRAAVEGLTAALAEAEVPLAVLPGADVRVDDQLLDLLAAGEVLTVGDAGTHLLLELPHDVFIDPRHVIDALAAAGVTAVVTHPERHPAVIRRPELVLPWVERGALLQVTAGSLCGDFGRQARAAAWRLVDDGLAGLVAGDAHDAARRPPRMSAAIELVEERAGAAVARRLCLEVPMAVCGLAGADRPAAELGEAP
jgi:protein-tyrosine phosphatase